jgi:hypothetical protein
MIAHVSHVAGPTKGGFGVCLDCEYDRCRFAGLDDGVSSEAPNLLLG